MTTVLIVDDSVANREITHELLNLSGYEVIDAADGANALTIAHQQRPQVIVTDVLMPSMDGYELARLLHEDPDIADVPVVFYSGNYNEHELRSVAGVYQVSRVVTKSSDPQPLLDAIDEVLHQDVADTTAVTRPGADADRDHLHLVNDKLVDTMQRLHGSEQQFQIMVDSAPVGIVVGTVDGCATYVNPTLAATLRTETPRLLGHGWLACLDPRHHQDVLTGIGDPTRDVAPRYHDQINPAGRPPQWLEVQLRPTDDGDGNHTGFIAIIEDVTAAVEARARRDAEQQRRAQEAGWRTSQRMESLRRLAGGAAHDYNNILAVVLAHGEFLQETLTEVLDAGHLDTDHARTMFADLANILRAGKRAAHLTEQLLFFGQRGPARQAAADINLALQPEIDILRATLSHTIAVTAQLAPGLPRVVADHAHLAQILRHLAGNAADAMPDGGTLHIETAQGGPTRSTTNASAQPGDVQHVRLTVRDNGQGMPANVLEHAIEPFYTTKSRALASGLGLASVHGIVEQSGGDLIIESEPGHGCTVHIVLPVAAPVGEPPAATTDRPADDQTVLVVDDEAPIRDLVDRILTGAGYRVLTAADAAQALDVARHYPDTIHTLLTDLVMPGMPGTELGRRLASERPNLSILYMSGYAEPLLGSDDATIPLLAKPFTKSTLLAVIRDHITQRQPGR